MSMIKTQNFEVAVYMRGAENAPKVALVLPGRLDSKDYAHMHAHVDFLAARGYLAATFDPPGTWESPGDISLYTMTNYIQATNELIAHFGNRPTLVVGHSRGSSIATYVGCHNPHVTALVSIMCSLTPGAYTSGVNEEWRKQGFIEELRDLPPGGGPKTKRYELPYSFFEDQRQYDLADGLRACTKPKLFILGLHDVLATPDKVRALYELAAEPKQLYELNSDHDYRHHPALIDEVNQAIARFLDKNKEQEQE
jgi:pimeloyl-ACP methyl ester carboxylesterase